jgi:hypothetical protein
LEIKMLHKISLYGDENLDPVIVGIAIEQIVPLPVEIGAAGAIG